MSDSDEDWFEEALGDSEGSKEAGESGEADEVEAGEEAGESGEAEETEVGEEREEAEETAEPTETGLDGSFEEVMDGSAENIEEFGGAGPAESSSTRENPFTEDFGTAFENAPSPEGDEGPMGGGGQGPMGGGSGEEFGFDDFSGGGGGTESFEEQELESELDRLDIGIEGLDDMILGGVPERSLMAAIGSAGTGKTTFGLQFLHTALERGENAVYISLEEGRERIINTADEKGWNFSEYEENGQLAIVDFDPIEMAHSLSSIQNELPRLIDDFGAERLVLDSVSLLEMMYDSPAKRRSEVFEFTKALKQAGVTTFVTSEASAEDSYTSRHGIIEYLADAVFVLQYVRPSDFRETRLAIEIQKIRDANHSRETKPYEITNEGISVYRQANIF